MNGRIAANRFQVKAYTVVDSLFHHRSNGAFVMVTTPIETDENVDSAVRRRDRFLDAIWPSLNVLSGAGD